VDRAVLMVVMEQHHRLKAQHLLVVRAAWGDSTVLAMAARQETVMQAAHPLRDTRIQNRVL
jgi:hypothetical protein